MCAAGNFLNGTICEKCPVGTWNNDVNQTTCNNCTEGRTTESDGAESEGLCGK